MLNFFIKLIYGDSFPILFNIFHTPDIPAYKSNRQRPLKRSNDNLEEDINNNIKSCYCCY